jgi:ABC-type nitrate/sulfonate/bicarbonate transport system substrate-binding protein
MKLRGWRFFVPIGVALLLLLGAAACGDDDEEPSDGGTPAPAETTSMDFFMGPTNAPAFLVADGEGFFEEEGIDANVSVTDEDIAPFLAGQAEVALVAPWEVATFINEGEDIAVFGTAGTITYFNGIAVRAENYPEPYGSIEDLVGTRLGNPGFGTGTWSAFEGFVRSQYGLNATQDFQPVEASPGALLGLIETGEIDGALLFSGQTLSAVGSGTFELVFRFDEEWASVTGEPLSIATLTARQSWLEENPDLAAAVIRALDSAAEWMADNPQEFGSDGKYSGLAEDAGWLVDDITNQAVQEFIADGTYYTRQSLYTDEYIDSTYQFIEIVVEDPPPVEEIFYRAEE